MKNYLEGALIANAAAMGFNWIYNMPYLERLAKTEDLVFQKADPEKYKRARKGVLAYPFAEIGDVSLQGEIAKWLYAALKENPELTKEDYENLVYDQIKPGGAYRGWVESFGKQLIYNRFIKDLEIDAKPITIQDDQLVGFVPYLVTKELGLSNEKAWELAQAFTDIDDFKAFYETFDRLFDDLKSMSIKDALQKSINYAPKQYGFKLTMALSMDDIKSFILQLVNTSCPIKYTIPLTYAILAHTSSYEEAVRLNTQIGGASSDRAMLIGAIYSQVSEIPNNWKNHLKT